MQTGGTEAGQRAYARVGSIWAVTRLRQHAWAVVAACGFLVIGLGVARLLRVEVAGLDNYLAAWTAGGAVVAAVGAPSLLLADAVRRWSPMDNRRNEDIVVLVSTLTVAGLALVLLLPGR